MARPISRATARHVEPGVAEQRRRHDVHERRLHALAGHLERVLARKAVVLVHERRVVEMGRLVRRLEQRDRIAIGEGEPDVEGQQERRRRGDRLRAARVDDPREPLREIALPLLLLVHGGRRVRVRGPPRAEFSIAIPGACRGGSDFRYWPRLPPSASLCPESA